MKGKLKGRLVKTTQAITNKRRQFEWQTALSLYSNYVDMERYVEIPLINTTITEPSHVGPRTGLRGL